MRTTLWCHILVLTFLVPLGCAREEDASAPSLADSSLADVQYDVEEDGEGDPDIEQIDTPAESSSPDIPEEVGASRVPIPTCEELTGTATAPVGHVPGDESTILFQDVTSEVGLPEMYTPTVSVGDVNGDGYQDLFVAGWLGESFYPQPRFLEANYSLFIGCGGAFFEYRIEVPQLVRADEYQPNASHIADMDSDGLVDLVLGYEGAIDILFQHEDGGFEYKRVWSRTDAYYQHGEARRGNVVDLTITDFNQDGALDIYVSHYGGVNPLLQGLEGRRFVERGLETEAHAEATGRETYASAVIPPVGAEDPQLLYLAHHAEPDQIWAINDDFQLALTVDQIPSMSSMGVDYYYRPDDEGIVAVASDTGGNHFYLLDDGQATPLATLGNVDLSWWGVQFGDLDNNGSTDVVSPPGDREEIRGGNVYQLFLAVFDEQAVDAVEGLAWSDQSATAGPDFDGSKLGNYSALVSADIDLDGCVDLFVTPMQEYGQNPYTLGFSNPVQLLRNRCGYPGNWVGFHLDDPGALISITLSHEDREVVRRADVQAGSSIGCDGASEQVHFGLGETSEIIRAEVRCSQGEVVPIPQTDVELNSYNDLAHLCPVPR